MCHTINHLKVNSKGEEDILQRQEKKTKQNTCCSPNFSQTRYPVPPTRRVALLRSRPIRARGPLFPRLGKNASLERITAHEPIRFRVFSSCFFTLPIQLQAAGLAHCKRPVHSGLACVNVTSLSQCKLSLSFTN